MRTVVWLLVAVVFIFLCYKLLPPYISNYELDDWLKSQVLFTLGKPVTSDALTESVLKQMKSLGIDATKENVHIIENDSKGVHILCDYTLTVDLKLFEMKLHFTPEEDNQSLVQ